MDFLVIERHKGWDEIEIFSLDRSQTIWTISSLQTCRFSSSNSLRGGERGRQKINLKWKSMSVSFGAISWPGRVSKLGVEFHSIRGNDFMTVSILRANATTSTSLKVHFFFMKRRWFQNVQKLNIPYRMLSRKIWKSVLKFRASIKVGIQCSIARTHSSEIALFLLLINSVFSLVIIRFSWWFLTKKHKGKCTRSALRLKKTQFPWLYTIKLNIMYIQIKMKIKKGQIVYLNVGIK